jgi:hypothetical protein
MVAEYSIRLCATINPRNEGGNSIRLTVDGACLCEMSYVWLDGSVVDAPIGISPLDHAQSVGRSALGQPAPLSQRLSAKLASVLLPGRDARYRAGPREAANRGHDCQIAYEPRYSQSFRNSYTGFWKAFGGTEVGGHAYLMPVTAGDRADREHPDPSIAAARSTGAGTGRTSPATWFTR